MLQSCSHRCREQAYQGYQVIVHQQKRNCSSYKYKKLRTHGIWQISLGNTRCPQVRGVPLLYSLAWMGTAVPPPPQALHCIKPLPLQFAQPTSPSDHRLQKHSTVPVPSHLGHSCRPCCVSLSVCSRKSSRPTSRAPIVKPSAEAICESVS